MMIALIWLVLGILASPFKSKYRLEVDNAALRHQVIVLRRQARGRVRLTNLDRLDLSCRCRKLTVTSRACPAHKEARTMDAPEKITGMSLEWTGHHHSPAGDFQDLSTHTLTYVTDSTCFATAGGKLVGEATYVYRRLDNQVGICIYRPSVWQGRTDVVLSAIFDFQEMTDRAVVTAGGEPFAVALGRMKSVPPHAKPAS